MKKIIALVPVVLWIFFLFTGCSGGDVNGTYKNEAQPGATLVLTKDGKFLHTPKGSGDYSVDGNTIVVSNPIFGGAQGKIEGNRLIFPESKDIVGESFAGTWVRQ